MKINETKKEIETITRTVIKHGLSIDENRPIRKGEKIVWEDQSDISIALKNIPYNEKYQIFNSERNYNFKMLDGALLQLMYEFRPKNGGLFSHRLAFLPSPVFEPYDNIPEDYEYKYYADSEFHDLIEKNVVVFPIRFDFNADVRYFKELSHPYSHATFGEYNYCRVPVCSPLTPSLFMCFILRNFYNFAYRKKGDIYLESEFRFEKSISIKEKKTLHFNIE